jgi:hypothetical protein
MRKRLPGGKKAEQLRAVRKKQLEAAKLRKEKRLKREKAMAERETSSPPLALVLKPEHQPKETAKPNPIATLQPIPLPKKWERLARRIKQGYEEAQARAAESMDTDDHTLFDLGDTGTNALEPTQPKAKAIPEAKAAANAKATTAISSRMLRQRQAAAERIDELVKHPERARKEIGRLNALVAKLTAQSSNVKPKALYIDEKWLAARWGTVDRRAKRTPLAG